jgi:hypothetical protein
VNSVRFDAAQISEVSNMIAAYIRERRDDFFPKGRELNNAELSALGPFFDSTVLQTARIHQLGTHGLKNPVFYPILRELGLHNLPDFSNMAAITFIDAVAFNERVTMQVLFHELVHVVQYKLLGVDGFASCYVRGFLSGGGYEGIPLEKNAYELDARFSANPRLAFDVEAEVRAWNDGGRF